MDIIFQNQDWLVINKPTGISSQAAFAGDISVPEWIKTHRGLDVHVFSRLDKGTSGVMIMALNVAAASRAHKIHESNKSGKEYAFLSAADSLKTGRGKTWEVNTPISGKSALTIFERVGTAGKYFLYRAHIAGGRVHQIRRHAKESRVAVLGDEKYGGAVFPRICLHCKSLVWPEIKAELKAPLPPSMGSLGDFASDPGFLVSFDRRLRFYEGVTDAFRCVQRGEMGALDCAIDYYGGWLCLWIYDETTPLVQIEERLTPYLKKLNVRYGARGTVIKRGLKNPHSRGLVQEQKIIGETPPTHIDVVEHGLKYRVSLTQGQHTGLFLDQRDNRLRVRQLAAGRHVANLFAYTCSFSTAALAGGAESVSSVDVAGPCLETGKASLVANGLNEPQTAPFIKEDVRLWLKRILRKSDAEGGAEKFGLIICDPPTFATTKTGGRFSVETEWEYLAKSCRKIGSADGDFLFCTNHRAGRQDHYQHILEEIFKHVVVTLTPLDFPVIDENQQHVKMFWCRGNK